MGEPLWDAIDAKDASAVRGALGGGADPSAARQGDPRQRPPLHVAAAKGAGDIVSLLLEAGADPMARDAQGKTALHWAHHPAAAQALLEAGVPVSVEDSDGDSPLFVACCGQDTVDELTVAAVVRLLIAAGADPNAGDSKPLHMAAFGGREVVAAALLESGADVNLPEAGGYTPLMKAVMADNPRMVKWLLDRGADPNRTLDSGARPIDFTVLDHIRHADELTRLLAPVSAARGGSTGSSTGGCASTLMLGIVLSFVVLGTCTIL